MKLSNKQLEALRIIGSPAMHAMLYGGSRSGKTFIILHAIITRALAAPKSRHAVLRFRFNHLKASIIHDTFPKVMDLAFPDVKHHLDKSDWFAQMPNESQIWFGGLDDKERTEKVLGQEHATIFLNEASQIPWSSRNLAITRLAQKCEYELNGTKGTLRLKALYDCNPPSTAHWTYRYFSAHRDPESNQPLTEPNSAFLQMNPRDNAENLPVEYIASLEAMPQRMRRRFLEGEFSDILENALFPLEVLDKWRSIQSLPDMQRVIVAVDPSGSGDEDNAHNDAIGIVVAGLGVDGNGYLLEDLTVKAGPRVWGNIATTAYDRHAADLIVAETNYGGEMVRFVVQAAKPGVNFRKLTASRGKVVRAEPIAALVEQGKIRLAGNFNELEDELSAFTTAGYHGDASPNRADAFVWAFTELFPGIARQETSIVKTEEPFFYGEHSWMV